MTSAELFALVVDKAIAFLVFLYLTLLGFRVVGKKPGESARYDDWHNRYGRHMKWLGPVVMTIDVLLLIFEVARRR